MSLPFSADDDTPIVPVGRPILKQLLASSVIPATDWGVISLDQRTAIERCPDQQEQLRELVRRKLLTEYQVARIEAGDWHSLILGNYRILDKIGAGAMGTVYRADHLLMRRIVAVKVLIQQTEQAEGLRRFFAEIQTVARLNHPNIVAAIDAGEVQGQPMSMGRTYYLVMEYVPGRNLDEVVREQGALPVASACGLITQLAAALGEIHRHTLVHRDVKPSNVRVTPDGQAKLLDFGLALCRANRMTHVGTPLGTPEYMAPEQVRDASSADARADIYGLGGVLYWCLTGHSPFSIRGGVAQVLMARLQQPPPSARSIRPELPAELDAILVRAMAIEPAQRYSTAEEMMEALAPFMLL